MAIGGGLKRGRGGASVFPAVRFAGRCPGLLRRQVTDGVDQRGDGFEWPVRRGLSRSIVRNCRKPEEAALRRSGPEPAGHYRGPPPPRRGPVESIEWTDHSTTIASARSSAASISLLNWEPPLICRSHQHRARRGSALRGRLRPLPGPDARSSGKPWACVRVPSKASFPI